MLLFRYLELIKRATSRSQKQEQIEYVKGKISTRVAKHTNSIQINVPQVQTIRFCTGYGTHKIPMLAIADHSLGRLPSRLLLFRVLHQINGFISHRQNYVGERNALYIECSVKGKATDRICTSSCSALLKRLRTGGLTHRSSILSMADHSTGSVPVRLLLLRYLRYHKGQQANENNGW